MYANLVEVVPADNRLLDRFLLNRPEAEIEP